MAGRLNRLSTMTAFNDKFIDIGFWKLTRPANIMSFWFIIFGICARKEAIMVA